jgi:hypothetical protein
MMTTLGRFPDGTPISAEMGERQFPPQQQSLEPSVDFDVVPIEFIKDYRQLDLKGFKRTVSSFAAGDCADILYAEAAALQAAGAARVLLARDWLIRLCTVDGGAQRNLPLGMLIELLVADIEEALIQGEWGANTDAADKPRIGALRLVAPGRRYAMTVQISDLISFLAGEIKREIAGAGFQSQADLDAREQRTRELARLTPARERVEIVR